MLTFYAQALSNRGRFWVAYFLLLIVGWFAFCGAALAHTEKHGQPVKERPPVWVESMSQDNWGGWKAHLGVSTVIGIATSAAADKWVKDPAYRLPVAFGVCLLPGLYRETDTYYNKPEPGYRHGLFSGRDMVSNAVGCGLGMVSYKGIRAIVTPKGASLMIDRTF